MDSDDAWDTDSQDFYAAIGQSISSWQSVEEAFFQILEKLVKPKDSDALAAAYYSLSGGGHARLQLVNAAANQALKSQPVLLKEWKALYKKTENEVKKRNNLVHLSTFVDIFAAKNKSGFRIDYALRHEKHEILKGSKYDKHITFSEISKYNTSFMTLWNLLRHFLSQLK